MTSGSATLEATCEFCFSFFGQQFDTFGVYFRYSRNHTHLNPNEEPFWRFSWDQMGRFDLPAMLDRVSNFFYSLQFLHLQALEVSGQAQLAYVGHSMGTTSFWVMMNWRPWMNQKVGDLC